MRTDFCKDSVSSVLRVNLRVKSQGILHVCSTQTLFHYWGGHLVLEVLNIEFSEGWRGVFI